MTLNRRPERRLFTVGELKQEGECHFVQPHNLGGCTSGDKFFTTVDYFTSSNDRECAVMIDFGVMSKF